MRNHPTKVKARSGRASRRRDARAAMAMAALLLAALAPAGAGKVLQAPYTDAQGGFMNAQPCHYGFLDRSSLEGSFEVYVSACDGGQLRAWNRMGGRYPTNAGELLGSFSAVVTARTEAHGSINCTLGSQASLALTVQKWRLSGSTWLLEQNPQAVVWGCGSSVSQTRTDTATFTFNAGTTYRLTVEANASAAAAIVGDAAVDFCLDATTPCGASPQQGFRLLSITVPNQAPKAKFRDEAYGGEAAVQWYVNGLVHGATARGVGCDPDGRVARLNVSVQVHLTGLEWTETPGSAGCLDGTHVFTPTLPVTYQAWAEATDDEGSAVKDGGQIALLLLPPLVQSVVGFPDLALLAEEALGKVVTITTMVGVAGEVEWFSVQSDGKVHMESPEEAWSASATRALVRYDRGLEHAEVSIGGEVRWSGPVVRQDPAAPWWHLRALADLPVETNPDPSPNGPVSFPPLASDPDGPPEEGPESTGSP